MLVPMAKVEVIGPKRLLHPTLALLHRMGVLHVEDATPQVVGEEASVRRMELCEELNRSKNELENLLVRINGIAGTMEGADVAAEPGDAQLYEEMAGEETTRLVSRVEEFIKEVEEKARELSERKDQLRLEETALARYEAVVEKIEPLTERIMAMESFEATAFLVEKKHKLAVDVIGKELRRLTHDQVEIISEEIDQNTIAALAVFNKRYSQAVHAFLADNVNEVRLPSELADQTLDVALAKIRERRAAIPAEIKAIEAELKELAKKWQAKLKAIAAVVRDRLDELDCIPLCGQTDYAFVIEGWLPHRDLKRVEERVQREFNGQVVCTEVEVSEEEREKAPVLLQNPPWARPFELVLGIFGRPRYGTLDPSPFLALFFPAFFGIIVGDVGYGLVILLAALWARLRFRQNQVVKAVTGIFISAALAAILFGFLYGEMFGDLPHKFHWIREIELGEFKLPFDRAKHMMELLYVCIGVGAMHILLGLVLGVINAIREHSKKHAIERVGMISVLVGIFAMVAAAAVDISATPGLMMILIGVVLLVYGAGMMGAMEIFGVLGNIFSYARLMALGLAGVILAIVANNLAENLGRIEVGIVVAGLLHALNIAVAAFSPSIHALRLNVIEFFNRFYEPGGQPYKPFKKER